MELGFYGLGRMGANMVRRLIGGGHKITVYNRTLEKVKDIEKEGAQGAYSLDELIGQLKPPRILWLMLPAGSATDEAINALSNKLSAGDILIEGGNSRYKDSIARAQQLKPLGIHFMDVGTSGGIWGLKVGYCLMIGGDNKIFKKLEPIFKTLAPKDGYLRCGPHGAGHFVKMVHNGIEYGMMQAYGEGFALLKKSPFPIDLPRIAHLWNQGSVVRSWLLELAEQAFNEDPGLDKLKGHVDDSGEGRWTVLEAVESGVAAPTIALSLFVRFLSRDNDPFSNKVLAALRQQFGGHPIKTNTNNQEIVKQKS